MSDHPVSKDACSARVGQGARLSEVLSRSLSRRTVIKTTVGGAVALAGASSLMRVSAQEATPAAVAPAPPMYDSIDLSDAPTTDVASGYTSYTILHWGDPLFNDSPAFDPANLSAASQAKQVGYNHDFIGFFPLPLGSNNSDNGILVVNHEYTNPELMFANYFVPNPDYTEGSDLPEMIANPTAEIVATELEAHGVTIAEIKKNADGIWEPVIGSSYNRRITSTTPFTLTGPAAGDAWLQTSEDATGTLVTGCLNNCSGGWTPWGTFLSGEENFHQYFGNLGALADDDPIKALHARYGFPESGSERAWEKFYPRFDIAQEPTEGLRHGWAIEIDPYDPASTPVKRTALGRAKWEAHTSIVANNGKVVIYSGDDERFEYAYKFVTDGTFNANDRTANLNLLDSGTGYVAKFNDDGTGVWLPLTFGTDPLNEANGFASQAQVLINYRAAADALGATKMDRPEDFEPNPVNRKIYLVCTNNTQRGTDGKAPVDAANPRAENAHGHIIEITESNDDHTGTTFAWELFLVCGDPADESTSFAGFAKDAVTAISCPDNITFDNAGNLWISTDGQGRTLGANDSLYSVPVEGPNRGEVKRFFSGVWGGELSGPVLTPDNSTLFISVQHPGEGGSYEEPGTTWPDDGLTAPRPSVVVIQSETGGPIGAAQS